MLIVLVVCELPVLATLAPTMHIVCVHTPFDGQCYVRAAITVGMSIPQELGRAAK